MRDDSTCEGACVNDRRTTRAQTEHEVSLEKEWSATYSTGAPFLIIYYPIAYY